MLPFPVKETPSVKLLMGLEARLELLLDTTVEGEISSNTPESGVQSGAVYLCWDGALDRTVGISAVGVVPRLANRSIERSLDAALDDGRL